MSAPIPRCRPRQVDADLQAELSRRGADAVLARFLAGRLTQPVDVAQTLAPGLGDLPNPDAIPDMGRAVARICRAIREQEKIVFAVDHDMDGQASAAVLWTAFTGHFGVAADRLSVVSSHRLREGYGITAPVVARIRELNPGLVISADKGSSDEARIADLKAAGIDVIVTDHHAVPAEGPPASAYACVNPTREDSGFDPTVCGAAVAFFCMARVRTALLEEGYCKSIPPLTPLLDYVAVATIADCVSLRPDTGAVNRTLVHHGLRRLNAQLRPCWQVFCESREGAPVDSQTVGFQLAPAVAAAGRLDWADVGFDFLTAGGRESAARLWNTLLEENQERKAVEKRVREAAIAVVDAAPLPSAIAVFLADGHSGVHGITASRLVERYGRPAAVFAPRGRGAREDDVAAEAATDGGEPLISGSFRSIPELHMRDALQRIDDAEPGLLVGFGGHAGAAGATLREADFVRFAAVFDTVCASMLTGVDLRPCQWVDGALEPAEISLHTVDSFARLDPWGRDFPLPQFAGRFQVESVRALGDGTHLKFGLSTPGGEQHEAIWFNAREDADAPLPLAVGESCDLIYRLQDNVWRGVRRLQLQVVCTADAWDGAVPNPAGVASESGSAVR